MPQPSKKLAPSRASRALLELANFFKAFGRFIYYKLTHPSEERWRAVMLCLALSGLFWFLRSMAKPASYVIPFQVKVKYDRKKYFLPEQTMTDFKASVTAKGWALAGMYSTLRSSPVIYKPELHTGYYKFRPSLISEHLQNRFRGIKVNYVVVPSREFPVDSMVSRQIPVEFASEEGRAYHKTLSICYFGPSRQVSNFPRQIDLTNVKTTGHPAGTVKSVFPKAWQEYICAGQRGQLLANLLHE